MEGGRLDLDFGQLPGSQRTDPQEGTPAFPAYIRGQQAVSVEVEQRLVDDAGNEKVFFLGKIVDGEVVTGSAPGALPQCLVKNPTHRVPAELLPTVSPDDEAQVGGMGQSSVARAFHRE